MGGRRDAGPAGHRSVGTINITEWVDDAMRALPAIGPAVPIGAKLSQLEGCWFYCKGTGRRMRDLARDPMANGSIIRIVDDCTRYEIVADLPDLARDPMANGSIIRIVDDCMRYEIVADLPVAPTSELPSHLSVHNYLLAKGSPYRASLHTHPIELVALTHSRKWMEKDHPIELVALTHSRKWMKKDVATRMLWSMIPETKAFCPRGLGMVPYMLPSSVDLAEATIQAIDEDYDVVMWEKHGVFAVDTDVMSAFDQVDVLNKSAQIYIAARSMGFEPEGMSDGQMQELSDAFHLPK